MSRMLCMTLLALSACGGSGTKPADLLSDVRSYSDGIRWQMPEQSAARLKPKERGAFLAELLELEEELRVDDYEITLLEFADERRTDARVRVRWTWHMDRQGIVHKTTMAMRWRRYGKRWILEEQRLIAGEPMPGTEEAREAEDEGTGGPAEGQTGEDSDAAGASGPDSDPRPGAAVRGSI